MLDTGRGRGEGSCRRRRATAAGAGQATRLRRLALGFLLLSGCAHPAPSTGGQPAPWAYVDRRSGHYWARLRAAHSFLAAFTVPITLYSGEETGDDLEGFATRVEEECWVTFRCDDHVSRTSGRFDGLEPAAIALRDHVTRLLRMRARHPALWNGSRRNLIAGETLYADLKTDADDRVLYLLNTGVEPRRVAFATVELDGHRGVDLLRQDTLQAEDDSLFITVAGLSARFVAILP